MAIIVKLQGGGSSCIGRAGSCFELFQPLIIAG